MLYRTLIRVQLAVLRHPLVMVGALALALLVSAALMGADLAAAQDSGVGERVGAELSSWSKAILLALVALVALPALAKRDTAGIVAIGLIALVIGGFAFAPAQVEGIMKNFWGLLGGGA